MSDTPRTDAAEEKARSEYERMREIDWPPFDSSPFEFARQLERELNAANERIKRLEEAGDAMTFWCADDVSLEQWNNAKQ